jgi:putative ABC transport system permease protein
MEIREGILLALSQVYHEKLKSAFTLLGVIIGVMFLIVVVSVVEGIDRYVTEDLAQQIFGINTITVTRSSAVTVETNPAQRRAQARRRFVSAADAEVIRAALTVPARVGVESGRGGDVRTWDGKGVGSSQISAISPEMLEIRRLEIANGRPFSPEEGELGMAVAVLGSALAQALFPDSDPIEQRIRVRGFPFRVVGVLESQGSLFGLTRDNLVLVPAKSPVMRALANPRAVGTIFIQTLDPADITVALEEAEGALRASRRLRPEQQNDFSIETSESELEEWEQVSRVLFVALPGLVSISLVVGGIVIMNIMLVSVMQRTREVGVRRAIGARQKDIITQFLAEATTLSGIGAVIGVSIGLFLTWIVRTATPLPVAVATHWVIFGVLLGMGTGVAAGVYPAVRASRMDPVEALRDE